jgi:cobalt-zinc-cadmium efflux system membrane fusion protein
MEQSQDAFDKAKVSVQADEESARLAQQAVTREQKAFHSNLYADQTVRANDAAYRQAQIQEAAALRALQLARTQILRDLEQARTDLQTAQLNYENSQHALDLLGHPNADGTVPITSPMAGVVTERDVSPGQVVDQSQETPWQMFVVSNADTVWVDADVHEADVAQVRMGAPVTIEVAGAPGREFAGRVSDIAPTLDKTSHTIKVRSVIRNPEGLLKDGMYADVAIHVSGKHNALVVPLAAVSHEQDGDYVYVPGGGQYHRRLVKLGATHGDRVTVTDGVKAGEQVVTHGALFLGAHVTDD